MMSSINPDEKAGEKVGKKNSFEIEYQPYFEAVCAHKAEDIIVFDVSKLTSYTNILIICSGKSKRQISAIAESIKVTLKKSGIKSLSIEGMEDGSWVLLDYGDVIIHLFYNEVREYYNLEKLWAGAKRINI